MTPIQSALVVQQPTAQPVAMRDVASVIHRRKRALSITFFSVIGAALLLAFLLPNKYESSAELLVERARADAVISPEQTVGSQMPPTEVSDADLASELELLQTNDILHKVVIENGLAGPNPSPVDIDKAAEKLDAQLKIDPIKKSNIIGVSYKSKNAQLSANVLTSLIALYMDKHLSVHRSNHEYQFFDQQAQLYKKQLAAVEKQISDAQFVAPMLTRDQMVGKRADLKASATQTDADIAETERRIASLKALEKDTPQRMVTEKKTSDNPQLMQILKGTLLTLQLERDQLVAKYNPSYRPVQDLDKRIADAKASIAREESHPLRDETTDQNAAFQWVNTELAKTQAQLQGLLGKQRADAGLLSVADDNLRNLNVDSVKEQDLQRAAKTAETNYLLYSQKREEARISDELDASKILNVAVVQKPSVPAMHVHQRGKILLGGMVAAVFLSLAVVLLADYFDPRFRSVYELATCLNVPVLASIPAGHEMLKLDGEPSPGNIPGSRTA